MSCYCYTIITSNQYICSSSLLISFIVELIFKILKVRKKGKYLYIAQANKMANEKKDPINDPNLYIAEAKDLGGWEKTDPQRDHFF